MKKILTVSIFVLIIVSITILFFVRRTDNIEEKTSKIIEKPLEKYNFENLRNTKFNGNPIALGETIKDEDLYTSQMFYFSVWDFGKKQNKKVSGLLNIPKEDGSYPVIVMLRGFVPKDIYETGVGTKRMGEFLISNNFITLAPDFLGYGQSDLPSKDAMEERFETYTTLLSLLSSLGNLNNALIASYSGRIQADITRVGLWGHSNGGQIALSILEITGRSYPTVLWAPVSKPFPYSILYYTDEFEDHGKALRRVVANFENTYDVELYSPTNFYSWINAPLQIHQGDNDDAVPKKWSDQLVEDLEELEKDVEYFVYPNSDHNLMPASPSQGGPDGWAIAVEKSLNFYRESFSK